VFMRTKKREVFGGPGATLGIILPLFRYKNSTVEKLCQCNTKKISSSRLMVNANESVPLGVVNFYQQQRQKALLFSTSSHQHSSFAPLPPLSLHFYGSLLSLSVLALCPPIWHEVDRPPPPLLPNWSQAVTMFLHRCC